MVALKSQSYIKKRLSNIFFTLFNKFENNNNADPESNGEFGFLNELFGAFHQKIILFDVGANVGNYCEALLKLCSKYNLEYSIHAFEPMPSSFQKLQSRFHADKNITLNNVGISSEKCSKEIYFDAPESSHASLYKRESVRQISLSNHVSIQLERLDEYLTQKKISRVDFLKLDIEGHELFALEGLGNYLSPDIINTIQFEYGGANLDSRTLLKDMFELLSSRGYAVYKIMKTHLEKRFYSPKFENFQYSNYIAMKS